jgi:hypothetical protein
MASSIGGGLVVLGLARENCGLFGARRSDSRYAESGES